MEESETNEAPLNRTSSRIKREKSSPQDKAISDINDDHTVEVQRTKRKKVSKDAKPKQNVGFKCSVVTLKSLIDLLSTDQCQWVRDCGFGALLDICNCKLPKRLTLWLINKFNYHTGALEFHGMSIPIKPLIQKLLALPAGDIPVTAPLFTVRGKTKVLNPNAEQREFRDDKGGRGKALHLVIDDLIACHVKQKFQRTFLLVVFCIYLAPTSSHLINRNYLECLNNMEEVARMNWCEYVADYLIQGIREYNESNATNIFVHGCVHILLLIYLDLLKSPSLGVQPGFPRTHFCTTELLEKLDSIHTRQQVQYKSLEELGALYSADLSQVQSSLRHEPVIEQGSQQLQLSQADPGIEVTRCSNHVRQDDKEQQLKMIEQQYQVDRDQCINEMKLRIQKLDAARSAAIKALLDTTISSNTHMQASAPADVGVQSSSANDEQVVVKDIPRGNSSPAPIDTPTAPPGNHDKVQLDTMAHWLKEEKQLEETSSANDSVPDWLIEEKQLHPVKLEPDATLVSASLFVAKAF